MSAKKHRSAAEQTLRDEFAASALRGLVSLSNGGNADHCCLVARMAWDYADAMIEARGGCEEPEKPAEKAVSEPVSPPVHTMTDKGGSK